MRHLLPSFALFFILFCALNLACAAAVQQHAATNRNAAKAHAINLNAYSTAPTIVAKAAEFGEFLDGFAPFATAPLLLSNSETAHQIGMIDTKGNTVLTAAARSVSDALFDHPRKLVMYYADGTANYPLDLNGDLIRAQSDFFIHADPIQPLTIRARDGKFGFVDAAGNWRTPAIYDGAGAYRDGRAMVVIGNPLGFAAKAGFIDATGAVVIAIEYSNLGEFANGRAWFCLMGEPPNYVAREGFLDTSGHVVILGDAQAEPMCHNYAN